MKKRKYNFLYSAYYCNSKSKDKKIKKKQVLKAYSSTQEQKSKISYKI